MNTHLLRNALLLSVLLNIALLGAAGWQKLRHDGLPMPSGAATELSRQLQLNSNQLQRWHNSEAPFLAYLRASNASLDEHRRRLIQAIFSEPMDRALIDSEQAKIAQLQYEQQRLLIDQWIAERAILEAPQRKRLADILSKQSLSPASIEQLHRSL